MSIKFKKDSDSNWFNYGHDLIENHYSTVNFPNPTRSYAKNQPLDLVHSRLFENKKIIITLARSSKIHLKIRMMSPTPVQLYGNKDDIYAFLIDRNLPIDDIQLNQIVKEIFKNPPKQGYLTISNALQWRLQYSQIVSLKENKIRGVHKIL